MEAYDPSLYGERWADVYDDWHAWRLPDADTVTGVLAGLAGGGPVLELGVGTGRLAVPLAARGVEVHGIDNSPAMVERLRAKPGGDRVTVHFGDMADADIDRRFTLVFVAFNTFFALSTQEQQVRCFRNVAAHLDDGGAFVVEAFMPDPGRFDRGQTVRALAAETDAATLEVSRHDPTTQQVATSILRVSAAGVEIRPVFLRYAWPSELDLMAQLAGLALDERWQDWQRRPFTGSSQTHVSVYRRP